MGWGEPIEPKPPHHDVWRSAQVVTEAVRRWRECPTTTNAEVLSLALDNYDTTVKEHR